MRILVVGAGATGGYFGARLAQAGRDVSFLVRPRRAAELRERGLRIVSPERTDTVASQLVTADEITGPYDLVLLSVKAAALAQAIEDLAPAVGPQTVILPFLNGMAHMDELVARFGAHAVFGGVVKVFATVGDEGDIVQLALTPPASIVFGELDGDASERAEEVRRTLDVAGFTVDTSTDIVAAMWHKWSFITTLGALTCLMRGPVGDIVEAGGGWLGPAILAETAAVCAAAGHPLPDREIAATTAMVTEAGSSATSSAYRDLAGGRPVEVEHVFGDLVARARKLGADTPLLDLATLHLRVAQLRLAKER
ncbi:MAG TPA: ketopantoate reductase family protein [Actinocrinis sp.]